MKNNINMNRIIKKIAFRLGYSKHQCTNCKKNSYLHEKDSDGIIAGFCRFCKHPIWFLLFLLIMASGCKTYNIYIVENKDMPKSGYTKSGYLENENRFTKSFINADSVFNASHRASKEVWDKVKHKYY